MAGLVAAGLLSLILAGVVAVHDEHHDEAEANAGNGGAASSSSAM